MAMTRSAGFDGRRFYYAAGGERVVLLDTEDAARPVAPSLRGCLLRQLRAAGTDAEAMGASLALILLTAALVRRPAVEPRLLLSVGGGSLSCQAAALLRAYFWAERPSAAALQERSAALASRVCVLGREGERQPAFPELLPLAQGALPAPAAGYDAVLVAGDAAGYEASLLSRVFAAAADGAPLLLLTGRRSVLAAAAAASAEGRIYPVTDHFVLYAGRKRGGRAQDLPVLTPPERRRVMVFLPYKAAMWDCLESIYRAAAADAETAAYVLPIPFAEKTPEGSVRAWHYEGDSLPRAVPVVSWQDVDLARLRPDAIFIHNPFDAVNTVTTVDACYYTPRLKEVTRELVYVPYFITGGNIYPELVVAPGYRTADHIICENESDREKFEQLYPGGAPPAGKFLPLGSPKLDKVRTDTRADHPLPAAWERLLAGRRALLYNVTLVAVLHNSAHFLPKLRWVLAQLRRQADVVLWWRPHPLLLSTLQSMRPDLVEAYLSLVQSYRTAGWGIYDDTPDLHRAIAWTDGYYGDYGSMVWLMQAAGRPTLIQNYGLHD